MFPFRFTLKLSVTKSIFEKYVSQLHGFSQKLPISAYYSNHIMKNHGRAQQHFSSSGESFAVTSRKINSALRILSLSQGFQPKDLRDAYFDAAKKCHPDSHSSLHSIRVEHAANGDGDDRRRAKLSSMFLEITEAYELLRKYPGGYVNSSSKKSSFSVDEQDVEYDFISKTEEQHYREAVQEALGIDAEALEESKRCPMFREWLKGKSHMAFHFNLFLMRHGGLAPMLGRKKVVKLTDGPSRRRKRR
jgi:hypothetical protein